jgi:hypothetical protein
LKHFDGAKGRLTDADAVGEFVGHSGRSPTPRIAHDSVTAFSRHASLKEYQPPSAGKSPEKTQLFNRNGHDGEPSNAISHVFPRKIPAVTLNPIVCAQSRARLTHERPIGSEEYESTPVFPVRSKSSKSSPEPFEESSATMKADPVFPASHRVRLTLLN